MVLPKRGKIVVNLSCLFRPHLLVSFSSIRRGGWGQWIWGIVISGSCKYHLIRVHENLVQNPRYIISISIYKHNVILVVDQKKFTKQQFLRDLDLNKYII